MTHPHAAKLEEIQAVQDHCDRFYPDQICDCKESGCDECSVRFLLDIARQAITVADRRDAVLEEAAKEAEDSPFYGNEAIAAAIRALQGKPITRKEAP